MALSGSLTLTPFDSSETRGSRRGYYVVLAAAEDVVIDFGLGQDVRFDPDSFILS